MVLCYYRYTWGYKKIFYRWIYHVSRGKFREKNGTFRRRNEPCVNETRRIRERHDAYEDRCKFILATAKLSRCPILTFQLESDRMLSDGGNTNDGKYILYLATDPPKFAGRAIFRVAFLFVLS